MAWTDEVCTRLRELHAEGVSAGQMANTINEEFGLTFTRSAIIGKSSRLGLGSIGGGAPWRAAATQPVAKVKRPRVVRVHRPTDWSVERITKTRPDPATFNPEPSNMETDLAIPQHQRRTLLELTSDTCRWPVGEPDKPDFFFCGAALIAGSPYCAVHRARAVTERPSRGGTRFVLTDWETKAA